MDFMIDHHEVIKYTDLDSIHYVSRWRKRSLAWVICFSIFAHFLLIFETQIET